MDLPYSAGVLVIYVDNPDSGSTYTIPSYVTEIGAYAFDGRNFETLIIPNTVRTIGNYAFRNCLNLKKVMNTKSSVRHVLSSLCIL